MKKIQLDILECAKFLSYCLSIGFITKDQLPELEKLFWKHLPIRHKNKYHFKR